MRVKLELSGKIEHFGNLVLRWMLASTVVKTDPAGNIKPDKEKSTQKIDGIVASIMALGEWMTAQVLCRKIMDYKYFELFLRLIKTI